MNQKQYCTQQLQNLAQEVSKQAPFAEANEELPLSESDQRFIDTLTYLADEKHSHDEEFFQKGQWFIAQCVANQAHVTTLIPRDLFWYFGGDCLHFMPDEEISQFQQLDEACYASEDIDYQEERSRIWGLH